METVSIKNLSKLDETFVKQAVSVYVSVFYKELSAFISKDKEKLVRAFIPTFVKENFYLALLDGKAVGVLAYSTSLSHSRTVDKKHLMKEFGKLKGSLMAYSLSKKPITLTANQGYLENLAILSEYRGRGIATQLISHAISNLPYDELLLEVVDTNSHAINIYKKLGFTVFKTKKQRLFRKKSGFSKRLYMKKKSVLELICTYFARNWQHFEAKVGDNPSNLPKVIKLTLPARTLTGSAVAKC